MNKMETDIYFKQKKLFDPHQQNLKVYVYGVGPIGSHVVVGLAKIGVKNITVYDYDKVEGANIPAQFFVKNNRWIEPEESGYCSFDDKITHIQMITQLMTGVIITVKDVKIEEDFTPQLEHNSIHIIAFDNIEGRKILIDKLDGYPVHIIDGRIGGYNWEKYYLYGQDNNSVYKNTLEGNFSEQECGEKCLWIVNSMIASKIIADIVKLSKGNRPLYMTKGSAMGDLVIKREMQDGNKA